MRVAIVGAGIAGLTVAHAIKREAGLRGAPIDLEVFEAGPRAGGRIHTISDAGFLIETAANAFRTGTGPSRSLVIQLELDGERVEASPDASRRYVYAGNCLHLLPAGPVSLLRFGAISPAGRLRVLAEPLFARRIFREESVHDYAARHIGGEAARLMLGTLVRGVYAGDSTKLSVDAAFPRMRELERRHRSLVIGMIREGREIRREGKALWSLARGMGSMIDRMAELLGPSIRTQMPALTLTRLPNFAASTPFTLRFASGDVLSYDAVVIATPPAEAAALLREIDRESANSLREIHCAGVAMVALAFRAEAFRTKPDGYGFLVAPGEDLPILGALFESNLFSGRAPNGFVLVRAILGGVGRPDLLTRPDADLVGLACQALDRAVGLKGGPEKTWVSRQEGAIPQYTLGHRERIAAVMSRLGELPGLYLAGNAYRGVSIGSIVEDADRVAEWVLHGAR